jgi:hypothetical protein
MAFGMGYASTRLERKGYAGFVGASLIFIAILSTVWAGLDPATDKTAWLVLIVELFGGLIFSAMFGFSFVRHVNLEKSANIRREAEAVIFGVFTGSLTIIIEFVVLATSQVASTGEGVSLSLMAPAAEGMLAVVAVYELLTAAFPTMRWYFKALASDIVFALFHWFHYGQDPKWLLLIVILAAGNTLFVWGYHITRNATVPIVAHLIVNVAPNLQDVLDFFIIYGPLLIIMFVVFFCVFKFFGGRHT